MSVRAVTGEIPGWWAVSSAGGWVFPAVRRVIR